ncbi:Pectate lyase [Altererythrobacter epoxidivorans]|uniref:Pectate lyase n=1 Tax=Altererythrobacter epoxidivorans TaxID=361183 RepID=A0A0M4LT18_9SPHN|nr:Pectate lyase [Altererythrobacter epoxidivorans]
MGENLLWCGHNQESQCCPNCKKTTHFRYSPDLFPSFLTE